MLETPLRLSPWLSARTGGDVFLKLETLQPTFSFKVRGALNAVLRVLERGERVDALVTASAGNHGRALAHAARLASLPLTVYVPESAPHTKLDAIRLMGAELRLCRNYDEAERQAKQDGASGRALFISPYSHRDVIAGAGTVGLEILEQRPDIDTFVVPVGGGGLLSGVAVAAKHASPVRTVVGVEVEASCPFTQSLAAGKIVHVDVKPTLADGLAGNLDPDTITFGIVRDFVDRVVTVSEPQLTSAVADLVREERAIVEGAAAAGVAAVLGGKVDARGRHTAVVLSGANIDLDVLRKILET